jgi:uncharacterized membrane protein
MAQGQASVRIARPVEDVWEVAGEFGSLATWMPGVDSCVLEGSTRRIAMLGMEIVEELLEEDPATHTFAYRIVSGLDVEYHRGTVTLNPFEGGTEVIWDVEVRPDAMMDVLTGVYQKALEALRAHLES